MDDQEDLPQPIGRLTVKPATEASIQAGKSAGPHTQPAPDPQQHDLKVAAGQVGYIAPTGPGGVCAAAASADPEAAAPGAQMAASPLIPEQPARAAPAPSRAAAIGPSGAELPTPPARAPLPVGLGGSAASGSSPATSQRRWDDASPLRAVPEEKVRGRAHPMKPMTGQKIADFAAMWNDSAYTLAQMARRYRCGERTVQDWRVDFGLAPRPEALRRAAQAQSVLGAAAGVVDAVREAAAVTQAMAKAPAEGQVLDPALDPMKDPEVIEALNDLRSEARIMTPHSDLTVLQRKLARLSVLVATKAPQRTWDSLQFTMESLSRALLRARQVEATIPRGDADPVMLRKEAAGQMMKELKSVLSPEDQAALGVIVKRGADALMAKGKASGTAAPVNGLPGTPAPRYNGKAHPHSAPG